MIVQSIFEIRLLEGSYEFGSVCLFLCPSVAHFFWNSLISFFRYWGGGLSFIRGSKVAKLSFLEKFVILEKKARKGQK